MESELFLEHGSRGLLNPKTNAQGRHGRADRSPIARETAGVRKTNRKRLANNWARKRAPTSLGFDHIPREALARSSKIGQENAKAGRWFDTRQVVHRHGRNQDLPVLEQGIVARQQNNDAETSRRYEDAELSCRFSKNIDPKVSRSRQNFLETDAPRLGNQNYS